VTAKLAMHLEQAKSRMIVVAHHPPSYGLSFPGRGRVELDRTCGDAFAGNVGVEQLLRGTRSGSATCFCGHTHRARRNVLGPIVGYNVGSDYPFKRLLVLDGVGGRGGAPVRRGVAALTWGRFAIGLYRHPGVAYDGQQAEYKQQPEKTSN